MSERWALGILFACGLVLTAVVFMGLWLIGAPVDVIGLGWMLVLIGTSLTAGLVTSHYAPARRRRDDD